MAFDDPLIERKLGDYTIVSLLGRGGMSRVYRGYDENLQRYAAVKVISGDFATTTEEEYTRRFTSEARAIAHLRHPNIVGVYQFGRTEGIYYMAQVFLEGEDLRSLLKSYAEKNQRIPVDLVLRIVRDVASALDYAHQQGVIHRDIKPSNIMLEKTTGRAILMDFGLAMSVHEGTMGDTFGSAHYIAPEQAISSAKSVPQSDQYSLGIVIYEMLAGKVPFDDPSIMSVALKHLNEVPPPPTMYNPDLPLEVEAVILKALHKDPSRRHASVMALADALEAAFAGAAQRRGAADGAAIGKSPETDALMAAGSRPITGQYPSSAGMFSESEGAVQEGGVAGRFARRRAQREQEVAQSRRLDEMDVPLDDQGIDSLLQNMGAPVERSASQGRLQAEESLSGLLRPAVPDKVTAGPEAKPRRSRVGLLAILLLLVAGIGAAAWFGLGLGGDHNDVDTTLTSVTGTLSTRVAGVQASITAPSVKSPTASELAATTSEIVTSPTLATPESSTLTPTSRPTQVTASAAVTLTTAAPEPSAAATERPVNTATAASSPIHTHTATTGPEESAVAPETGTETPQAVSLAATGQDIRMIYDSGAFLLINVSGHSLDISRLVFERTQPDGSVLSFQASLWDRSDITIKPSRMVADGCYQLVTTTGTQAVPELTTCPLFLGFFRSNVSRNYFWTGGDAGAVFVVRQANAQTPLATCMVAAGECAFEMARDASEDALDSTPPVGQVGEPTIRLTYDNRSFFLINISAETQDVSRLYFIMEQPDGVTRSFLSAEWDDAGIAGDTSSLNGGGCLELVTSEADVVSPDTTYCTSLLGWFRSNQSERYFWISSVPDQTFEVRIANEQTLLAQCEISAGVCEFTIPEQP